MSTNILYVIISGIVAFLVAAFFYYYKVRKANRSLLLFMLRFLTTLSIILLLLNLQWETNSVYLVKPNLVVAIDNSTSIAYLKQTKKIASIIRSIRNNKKLQDRFRVTYLSFGSEVRYMDSLNFKDNLTNQTQLLQQVEQLFPNENLPLLLLTDGNQTKGDSYEYFQTNKNIYPIILGDTTQYEDIQITQINTNTYSLLDNRFPIEVFALYDGKKEVTTQFSIFKGKQKIFSRKLYFTKDKHTQSIQLNLSSDKIGIQFYTALLTPLSKEKNIRNNRKNFSIEVIDQQANILLLSSFYHPDLGAIKRSIESNKQRKVTIKVKQFDSINLSDYQLAILYQPNSTFSTLFTAISNSKLNTFIITGTKTDWSFLNTAQSAFSKKVTSLTEKYLPSLNTQYADFVVKDIGFNQLPPLNDTFGTIYFNSPYQSLLFQKIGYTTTQYPLLATYTQNTKKNVVLFGENIWKWRMQNAVQQHGYNTFDNFFNNLIQYSVLHKQAKQIQLHYDKICYKNKSQRITATVTDQNYQVNNNKNLWLTLTNKQTKNKQKIPFSVIGGVYQVDLDNLTEGSYSFSVTIENSNQTTFGRFNVIGYSIEQQFNTADLNKLSKLVSYANSGEVIFPDQTEKLFQKLVNNSAYRPIQKTKKNLVPIIHWRWLLGIIILSLSIEWFIRKYRGLI